MQSKEMRTVVEFCLDNLENAPLQKRVDLYLGLAEFCGEPSRATEFRKLAATLAAADAQCREFAFKLKEDNKPKGTN